MIEDIELTRMQHGLEGLRARGENDQLISDFERVLEELINMRLAEEQRAQERKEIGF